VIAPAKENKLPWKMYGIIFAVWATFMLPVAWIIWGSGPGEISALQAMRSTPGVAPGLAQDRFLDSGVHGIWLTREQGGSHVPMEAFRVVGPTGQEQRLFPPPGESVRIRNGQEETSLLAVFRAGTPGNYSLFIDLAYVPTGEGRFGPAWENGQIIDSSRGVGALIFGWIITVGCATFALRKTVRSSLETVE
jgi:hypothetical protein